MDAKEYKIPAGMLVVGLGLLLLRAGLGAGEDPFWAEALYILLGLAVSVAIAVPVCFLAASLLGVSFGLLSSAVLKLAGIFAVTSAIRAFVPFFGGIISLAVYLSLLVLLFELEWFEALVYAILLWLVNVLVVVAILAAVM